MQRYSFELPTIQEAQEEISHPPRLEPGHSLELPTASEAQGEISHSPGLEPGHSLKLPTASEAQEEISHPPGLELDHSLELPTLELPTVQEVVEEMSHQGGKVRLRTPLGQPCEWRDYKGVNLHDRWIAGLRQNLSPHIAPDSRK